MRSVLGLQVNGALAKTVSHKGKAHMVIRPWFELLAHGSRDTLE